MTFLLGGQIMENNNRQNKRKFRLEFRHIYALCLFAVTFALVLHVLNLLVLTPRRTTGVLVHGYRMESIQYLEEAWKTETEYFGSTLDEVDYVSIFWNTGPVVFVNVRVESGTSLSDARSAATEVVEYLIDISDEVVLEYDIQVVVSYGDVSQQREENHDEVIQHVHSYNHSLVEAILAHAEQHSSEFNVDRAYQNINGAFTDSIIIVVGEEGLEEMRSRLEAIEVAIIEVGDDESESYDSIPRYLGVRQIPQSNIADFPNWGTWDNQRSRMIWTP